MCKTSARNRPKCRSVKQKNRSTKRYFLGAQSGLCGESWWPRPRNTSDTHQRLPRPVTAAPWSNKIGFNSFYWTSIYNTTETAPRPLQYAYGPFSTSGQIAGYAPSGVTGSCKQSHSRHNVLDENIGSTQKNLLNKPSIPRFATPELVLQHEHCLFRQFRPPWARPRYPP